ncbi:aldo/keto reductase [Brevundimonas sp. S30B]|nr:aldo/keto reductase [Brevundimonas sp. MF30-B]TFW04556.1 aldo/keto reductase [Brevundimonas sp. S30B]
MRFDALPSPADRLAIAAVTEPERAPDAFMTAPVGAREDAMRHLLQTAADAGVGVVATRPEGDVERLLGQAWPFPSPFRVTVRTVALADGLDRIEARARRSLERMGLPRGEALLVSNAADLAGAEGRALWDRLKSLKDRGLFRKIGFCATLDDGPALLARRLEPDLVQIPCNLLDQRAATEGVLAELKAAGAEIHIAHVFAQGVLFAAGESLPPELAGHALALSRVRRRLAESRLDPMQAALAFALNLPEASAVVASVASAAELRAVLAAAHAPAPAIDWSALALETPAARSLGQAADIRYRINSAA